MTAALRGDGDSHNDKRDSIDLLLRISPNWGQGDNTSVTKWDQLTSNLCEGLHFLNSITDSFYGSYVTTYNLHC